MDNEQLEMLKEDLIEVQVDHPTRLQAAYTATRITDAITDLAQDIATKAVEEHATSYKHDMREGY